MTVDYIKVSRSASELSRWAMFFAGENRLPQVPSSKATLVNELEECAAALGYKLVKAEAPAASLPSPSDSVSPEEADLIRATAAVVDVVMGR